MESLNKKIVVAAAVLAGITIAIGAFGAHGLKQIVDTQAVASFETGVRYQMYHALALLAIGFAKGVSSKSKKQVFWFFMAGIVCFSGSIYLLALKEYLPFSVSAIAFVTPFGGLLFIVGWLRLANAVFKL